MVLLGASTEKKERGKNITYTGDLTACIRMYMHINIHMNTYIFAITIAGNECPAEYEHGLVVVYRIKSGLFCINNCPRADSIFSGHS